MIDDALIKAILEISNNDKLAKMIEPSLMWHSKIEEWMITRIFKAVDLMQEEYDIQQARDLIIAAKLRVKDKWGSDKI